MTFVELRVHGVGGPNHARMLGVASDADVFVEKRVGLADIGQQESTAEPSRTDAKRVTIVRRKLPMTNWHRQDDGVRGFSWGELTSGSFSKALWVLLLPLSLTNLAGWAVSGKWKQTQRLIAHALAFLATFVYVAWPAYIWLDLIALQWRRRLLLTSALAKRGGLNTLVRCGFPLVAVGVFLLVVVLWLVQAHRSEPKFAHSSTESSQAEAQARPAWADCLADPDFFTPNPRRRRFLWAHTFVAATSAIAAVGMFIQARSEKRTLLNTVVLWSGIIQGTLCFLLFAIVVLPWITSHQKLSIAFPAATIGAATSHAAFSGVGLMLVGRLQDWPKLPDCVPKAARETFQLGGAISAPNNYALAVIISAVLLMFGALIVGIRNKGNLIKMARGGLLIVWAFALGCSIAALGYCQKIGFDPRQVAEVMKSNPTSISFKVGASIMTGIPLLLFRLIVGSRRPTPKARSFAIVWDLLMFWPRRFHPLAVPSYGQIAVPLLAEEVKTRATSGRVILSAHSQGSVLTVAALHRLRKPENSGLLANVDLVTYGSPLGTLYADAFPDQYPTVIRTLTDLSSWTNFYRTETDPIGGVIREIDELAATDNGSKPDYVNVPLPDPLPSEPLTIVADDPGVPLEWTRSSHDGKAGHSWYLADPTLKAKVLKIRGL